MRAYQFISEKAVSKKQQQFFGIVRAMQKGDMPKSGEAGEVAKDMKKSDVKDFAKTKHKGLPTKKKTNEGAEITVYTDPSYQGATLDDKYWNSKPSQKIDFHKLEPFEPADKMKGKKSADNMKRFVDKIKAGEEIKPIIVTPKDGKYLILDGHHRYFAARIAKVDSMEAVIVPEKYVTFTDEVPDESEQHKQEYHKEEAAGVGIVTKQNATADVPVGGEYMNVKKLFPKKKKKKESIAYEDMKAELNPKSEIYVDMDGVLADFFGEWKKLVGKDWRELEKDEIEPALKKIRDEDEFWLNIPLTSNAKNLLNIIKKVKGDYKILSSPLANDPNSEPHKREWIKKNLDFFPPTEVIITKDKAKYATNPDGTPNILIDDYGVNIAAWESAGGIGFKHKDHKFERTAKKLKADIEESFQNLVREYIEEGWSAKYKKSINCSNPKGFSQKAHCAGKKKSESIHEGRDAPLYHETDEDGIIGILSSGVIKPKNIYTDREAGEEAEIGPRISLTRDRDLGLGDFKIVIDQRKLAQTHKITPYTPEEYRDEVENEAEEYVQKPIPLSYITAIHTDDATDELKDLAKRAGIPVVNGSKPI